MQNLGDILRNAALQKLSITFIMPDQLAEDMSYAEIYQASLLALGKLQREGVKPGDELIIYLPNIIDFTKVFWACQLGGIIAVPLSINKNQSQLERLLNVWNKLDNPSLITDKQTLATLGQISHKMSRKVILFDDHKGTNDFGKEFISSASNICLLQFTSGSTGNPKGATLTHANILANCRQMQYRFQLHNEDVSLSFMPLTHAMGLVMFHIFPAFALCRHIQVAIQLFIEQPLIWAQLLSDYKVNFTGGPNFSYQHLLNNLDETHYYDWNLASVNHIINLAEPIAAVLAKRFIVVMEKYSLRNNVMRPTYGLAESSVLMTSCDSNAKIHTIFVDRNDLNIGDKIKLPSENINQLEMVDLGTVVPEAKLRIVTDDNSSLLDEHVGHIQIQGPNIMSGYYNDDAINDIVFTSDNWLHTGDIGFVIADKLFICGRSKDVIFFCGKNYYAEDVEMAAQINNITLYLAAACGVFDYQNGKDNIILFLQYKSEIDEKFISLTGQIKSQINAKVGLPIDYIIPINEIPRTSSGKLQRSELRRQFECGVFTEIIKTIKQLELTVHNNPKNKKLQNLELEFVVRTIWSQVLQLPVNQINIHDKFMEIGGTSFSAMKMLYLLQNTLGIKLDERILVVCKSISEMINYLQSNHKIS